MFNQPHARLYRTKVTFEDYRYQLYVDGKKMDKVEVPYHIWRKYYLAQKRFDKLKMSIEKAEARGDAPILKLLIDYFQAVKDYMTAKIELEIYYYGAKTPEAKHGIQNDEEAKEEEMPDL
ncbi:MAG: hypothetical protein ACLGJB_02980 [Blastocatellia bacterium]